MTGPMSGGADLDTGPVDLREADRADSDCAAPDVHRGGMGSAVVVLTGAGVAMAAFIVAAATGAATPVGGLGLAETLPAAAWLAIVVAGGSVAWSLCRARVEPVSTWIAVGVLLLCTYGLPSAVQEQARLTTTWLHIGFIDALVRYGTSPLGVDSRFSWPGFFALWAQLDRAVPGFDLGTVARWFPVVIVACWCVGVYALAQNFLPSRRQWFLATVLFLLFNWIEQDYFSPQALSYLIYLVVLNIVIKRFPTRTRTASRFVGRLPEMFLPTRPWSAYSPSAWELFVVYCVAGGAILVLVPSHQLTPVILVVQLALLGIAGKKQALSLAFLTVVAFAAWFIYGATEFWLNQLQLATGDAGNVGANLAAGVTDRLRGDPAQTTIKYLRFGLAALAVGLGLLGSLLVVRGRRTLVLPILALSSVVLPLAQAYGGEVMLRSLLYGLPFWSILGVMAVTSYGRRLWVNRSGVIGATAGIVVVTLSVLLVVLRGGNDAYAAVDDADITAEKVALDVTPRNDTLLHLEVQGPYFLQRVAEVKNARTLGACTVYPLEVDACIGGVKPYTILVLPSMERAGVLLEGLQPGWTTEVVERSERVYGYRVVFDDGRGRTVLIRGLSG